MKVCTQCKIEKEESEFSKRARASDGLCSSCKECVKKCNKKYREENKDKISEYRKENKEYYKNYRIENKEYDKNYYLKNKDKIKERGKNYYLENKNSIKENKKQYYLENKNEFLENAKQYRLNNKDHIKEYKKNYRMENKNEIKENKKQYAKEHREEINKHRRDRKKTDITFALICNLRGRVYMALKGNQKSGKTLDLLGCSIEEFKLYLEAQFHPGMSWENYGSKWQIDHIIAFKDIDILDEGQLKIVLSYKNLRPIWSWANLARNGRPDSEIDFSSPIPKYFEINYDN